MRSSAILLLAIVSSGLSGACTAGDLARYWRGAGWADQSDRDFDADTDVARTGTTYFVRPDGDDAANGTCPQRAWRTLDRVNAQAFAPGDRVLFAGGHDYDGNLSFDAADRGTADAPITIGSFARGRARLRAGSGTAIEIVNTGGFVIQDLVLQGGWDAVTQQGNTGDGLRAENTLGGHKRLEFLRFRRLDISGFMHSGIAINGLPSDESKEGGYHDVAITDSDVHDNGDFGVTTNGPFTYDPGYSHAAVTVRGVRVYNQRGIKSKPEHTGSGIMLSDVDGALVEHSIAYNNGEFNSLASNGGFGIWAWDSNDVVLQYNEAYQNKSATGDGGGFDLDGGVTNSVMQYNYSHDNHGAGCGAFQFAGARPFADNAIRYNITQNDGISFLLWDGNWDMGALDVYHNAGWGKGPLLATYSPFLDVGVYNNVFFGVGPTLFDVYDETGLALQGNDYWVSGAAFAIKWNTGTGTEQDFASFEAYRVATGQETAASGATGLNADPKWNAAGAGPTLGDTHLLSGLTMYQLQADSPLIDRGVDLAALGIDAPDRDFFARDTPTGAGADIGVQERQ